MSGILRRRNSMTLLSLYDLESFVIHPVSVTTKQLKISTNDQRRFRVKSSLPKKCVLEDLPNELLIYIFEFLSAYDLYHTFYNLNSRLNTIYHAQKFYLDFTSEKHVLACYCSNQRTFASKTYSIKISGQYNRLTLVNQYINIDRFTNVRVLILKDESSSENFDKIMLKLYLLPYLTYLYIYSVLIQLPYKLNAIFRIKSLQRLILHSFDPILLHFDNNTISPLIQLEYLSLTGCYLTDFFELLKYVGPSLKKMNICLLYQRQKNLTSINSLTINQLFCNNNMPKFLCHLQISFTFLSLTNFQLILQLFPHLTHLTFFTLTDDINFISGTIWHSFISLNLLELKNLQFDIGIIGLPGNDVQRPPTKLVDLFYEMNKNWLVGPVIMDFNSILNPPLLEFYTYSQPAHGGKYSTELYGKERYIVRTITDIGINIDKNITHLKITLTDAQQTIFTTDQLSMGKENDVYPKVKTITIRSQMTITPMEIDEKSSLICSDLMKSIPDLSKITKLNFTNDWSSHSTYPSATLARRLLNKMPKITTRRLSYDYFLHLLEYPLVVQILTKQIRSLWILFYRHHLIPKDMILIMKVFRTNLHSLYFGISYIDFLPTDICSILPLLFSEKWKKLYMFNFTLLKRRSQRFPEPFKRRLHDYLNRESERRKTNLDIMEYRITDNEFSISF